MNRRIPDGTYGGVGRRGLVTPSYPIEVAGTIGVPQRSIPDDTSLYHRSYVSQGKSISRCVGVHVSNLHYILQ